MMEAAFILKTLYLFVIAVVLAVLEIQIEGKFGWAEKLPTWRPAPGSRLQRWYFRLAKKDLTGYHLALGTLLFLWFHFPFVVSHVWSWQVELQTLASFAWFIVIWDFLWFVLNSAYPLKHFNAAHIWWHRVWWWKLPSDYWVGLIFTILLYMPLIVQTGGQALWELGVMIGLPVVLVGIVIFMKRFISNIR